MTLRSKINHAAWIEVKNLFLYDIMQAVKNPSINDEFIINVDQVTSKYMPTYKKAMAKKRERHVPKKGENEKEVLL